MPIRLDTVLNKVDDMANRINSNLLKDFYQHMKDNDTSKNYQKGNLKAMVHFAEHIGATTSFYTVDHKQVVVFLETKMKHERIDSINKPQIKRRFSCRSDSQIPIRYPLRRKRMTSATALAI
jgi:hypothetical protein